jgi:flagellar protein FliO/FliZ
MLFNPARPSLISRRSPSRQQEPQPMPQWIVDIVGESLAPIVWVALVAVVVCLLAIVVIMLARKAFGGAVGGGFKGRAPRLAIMDVARIDEKRRLILVRRDEVEHLVLVGGQTDLLLEGNILRLPAAARARSEPQLDRMADAEEAPAIRRWEVPTGAERHAPPREGPPREAPMPVRNEPRQQGQSAPAEPVADTMPSPVAAPAPVPVVAPAPGPAVAPIRPAEPAHAAKPPAQDSHRVGIPDPHRAGTNGGQPPAPSVQPVQQRSMATPTLPVPGPKDAAAPSPTAQRAPSRPQQASDRVEPSLTMPDPRPQAPDMARQRAEIRDRLNRTPAPALDKTTESSPERRPLSVRSFATAIQNRGSGPEQRPPAPAKAEPAVAVGFPTTAREEPNFGAAAAAPKAEPSLQDFLSAELDSELSRDDAPFAADVEAENPPAKQAAVTAPDVAPDPEPEQNSPAPAPETRAETTVPKLDPAALAAAPTAASAEPARKLTLEEEMERLLGDFSFGDSEQRSRG